MLPKELHAVSAWTISAVSTLGHRAVLVACSPPMAFERVWLGCGLNAALAGLQVVFSCAVADMDVLSRVMYLKDGKAAWPKVLDLEAFAKTSMQKVAALGNWTEKLDALPGTIDALAKIDSLKVIVLQCLEPLLDFNPSAISNWSGAWTEASSGYILSMVRKPSCTTDVAKITSKLVGAYMKRGSAPPTLSTADPFAGLVKVNLSEPKWKGVLPPTLGDGVVRFVNTGKKARRGHIGQPKRHGHQRLRRFWLQAQSSKVPGSWPAMTFWSSWATRTASTSPFWPIPSSRRC